MSDKKKTGAIGCLVFLLIVVPPYFYFPTGLAIGFTVVCSVLGFIIPEMTREIGKIKQRKATNKSTIAAAQEGFVEIVAKVKGIENVSTWLEGEKADFTLLKLLKWVRNSRKKNTIVSFYEHRSSPKKLLVTDGSADAWVSLHETTMHLTKKKKQFKKDELLKLLEKHPLPNFNLDELKDKNTFWVEEHYITKGEYVNFYGIMHKLNTANTPAYILKYKDNRHARHTQNLALDESDWQEMIDSTHASNLKLLTADYSAPNYIEKLLISLKGDHSLRLRSYLNLFMMLVMILVILSFFALYVWKGHPEVWEATGN